MLRILCGTDMVATHQRSWDKEGVFFDFRHYLALLERKPGALDFARPLEGICLPECLKTLRRLLEADLGHEGTREFIKVLRLLERATMVELTDAVTQALAIGATGSDVITCILLHHKEAAGCPLQPGWPSAPQIGGRRSPRSRRIRQPHPKGRLRSGDRKPWSAPRTLTLLPVFAMTTEANWRPSVSIPAQIAPQEKGASP